VAGTTPPAPASAGTATADLLRRSLLGLAAVGTVGTAFELALLRHWESGLELIPWIALGILGVAIWLLAIRPVRRRVLVARALSIAVAAIGAIGVLVHVRANYEAAPLDFRSTDSWPTTAEPIRWLLAATDTVGPSPTLAPTAITFIALVLLAATIRHGALTDEPPS
jgi:hypothetical protein